MAEKIRALSKRPGCPPRLVWVSNSLENLQNHVGGYIETVTLATDCCVICNEEGRLMGLPYNCTIAGVSFVGDILIVGMDGEAFTDLPISFYDAKRVFKELWEGTDPEEKGGKKNER